MEGEVIKAILYNRDGTVDYVIDNEKLNEVLEPCKRVQIYVVYLDGKPLSRDTGRKVAYLEPSGAKATVTVLARRFCEDRDDGYYGYGSSQENKERLIEIEKARFEIRIFIDSDEVIC